ncbi:flagellar basal body P-ring formation chaperone FlgA [Pseudoalteromonas mariniglutinosa]|uniref:flagellar basal body P-ring formation chaperone FlgA n=1 Tax=Pseudoalteromonas mariniglutinosa TaxID=206042 RepID=UPI00384E18E1
MMAIFSTFKSYASAINFQQQLHNYINQEIELYLQRNNTSSQQRKIDLYIPKGSTDLQCEKLSIKRSRTTSPPAGRIRMTVQCQAPKWQFRASAKVDLWLNLVIAKRDLQRGEVLTPALLSYRSLNIADHLHGMETNSELLIGMEVRRDIDAGDIISRRLLEKKYLVNRDQHVELQVATGGFNASVTAVALEDGQLGQRIKVKNLSSGKIIEGQVVAKGVVQASL